jgi:8-oxo-dGTP pyrophosphatase MutT (NUDIX family)
MQISSYCPEPRPGLLEGRGSDADEHTPMFAGFWGKNDRRAYDRRLPKRAAHDLVAWCHRRFRRAGLQLLRNGGAPRRGWRLSAWQMAPHTVNGGQIYFPAGTPDPSDVVGGKVDLDASARRELFEETGVRAEETVVASTWTVVFAGSRIAWRRSASRKDRPFAGGLANWSTRP